MDWNALLIEITPSLTAFLTALISALLVMGSVKLNAWIKANVSAANLVTINLIAKNIVLFLEQVGEMRGWDSNADKKEYAVNRLIADAAAIGVAVTLEQADVAIEAAVMEFTNEVVSNLP